MSLGAAIALMTFPMVASTMTPVGVLALSAAMVVPTALQPFVQRKPYKIVARLLLGAGSAFYVVAAAWTLPWTAAGFLWRLAAGALFVLTSRAMLVLRESHLDDPCASCPYGRKPFCGHYLPAFEALSKSCADPADRQLAQGLVISMRESGIRPLPSTAQTSRG